MFDIVIIFLSNLTENRRLLLSDLLSFNGGSRGKLKHLTLGWLGVLSGLSASNYFAVIELSILNIVTDFGD